MSPAWRFVGRFVRFTEEVELSGKYVRRTLDVEEGEDMPEVSSSELLEWHCAEARHAMVFLVYRGAYQEG